jgi:hypothetical protein
MIMSCLDPSTTLIFYFGFHNMFRSDILFGFQNMFRSDILF